MASQSLEDFFDNSTPLHSENVIWGKEQTPLKVTTFLTTDLPPLDFVTSVRAIVFSQAGDDVFVCTNADGETHIVPGGRREAGESLIDTLEREILEEIGWHVTDIKLLAVWRCEHLAPKQPSYRYPYPIFVQIIYTARAHHEEASLRQPDDYELDGKFLAINELEILKFEQPSQLAMIRHLVDSRSG